jgi:hypothetical protein
MATDITAQESRQIVGNGRRAESHQDFLNQRRRCRARIVQAFPVPSIRATGKRSDIISSRMRSRFRTYRAHGRPPSGFNDLLCCLPPEVRRAAYPERIARDQLFRDFRPVSRPRRSSSGYSHATRSKASFFFFDDLAGAHS